MDISEFELIRRIVKQIPKNLREIEQLRDDTAVIAPNRAFRQLLTTDAIVENVDFRLNEARPEDIGKKALAINLSDIAAMGGTPEHFTIALGIPQSMEAAWVKRFYSGVLSWARRYNVVCAGGDISRAPIFFASITVLGHSKSAPILRRGARSGDWIGVTGQLGGSRSGHHLYFKPRIEEGQFLADNSIHAMIDLSDGLIQDLGHVLEQSKVGCELELTAIPIAKAAQRPTRGRSSAKALEAALTDGEDFELLFTASSAVRKKIDSCWKKKFPKTKLSWIGKITHERKKWKWLENGKTCGPFVTKQKGYQHFE